MHRIPLSSTTRLVFLLVDATDDETAETGISGASITVQLSKNGGSFATATNTPVEIGSGFYYVTTTTTETNTAGPLAMTASASGTDVWRAVYWVGPGDANITQVAGSSVSGVNDFKADVSALATAANLAAVKTQTDKLTFNAANVILADVREVNDSAVTGVADFKADVSALATAAGVTGVPAAVWGYGSGRTITGGTISTVSDKTGYSLAAGGLDLIDVPELSTGSEPESLLGLQRAIFDRLYRRNEMIANRLRVYVKDAAGGDSGVLAEQTLSDDNTTQVQQQATWPA